MSDNYFISRSNDVNSLNTHKKSPIVWIGFFILLISIFFGGLFLYATSSTEIQKEKNIIIPQGATFSRASDILRSENIIRSSFAAQIFGRISQTPIQAGVYQFVEGKYPLSEVLRRLTDGDYGDVFIKITIPEGSTNKQIANILGKKIPDFNNQEFEELTKDHEGYLFPETYLFLPGVSTGGVIEVMLNTFQEKTKKIQQDLGTKSLEDIIIMASLIEKEATRDKEEQKIVSGILWKRISIAMPLQVDAPFLYTRGKTSAQLSLSDLRADGPYNTYTRKGLTPTPIGNPGLSSIEAALSPKESSYLFYLHDNNGGIHYGVTHDDHVKNKQKYL
jgi:UPF0755 protein